MQSCLKAVKSATPAVVPPRLPRPGSGWCRGWRPLLGLAAGALTTGIAGGLAAPATNAVAGGFNVRDFGAVGDGRTLDTPAINQAIDAASAAGGGTVRFPAGTYLSASIHLKSNLILELEPGSVIEAVTDTVAPYDAREPNASTQYQDSGHSHWHDALIWGEDLENVSILGPGLIYGRGLQNGLYGRTYRDTPPGSGNKAISLVRCHNVTLRDFSLRHGGWFGILATGVDNLTIDNLKVDTNRDGMDIDCCHNVRILNCSVNSPWDDGICLKSSYALGYARATENVTIANCFVTGGLIEGTLIDGTFQRAPAGYAEGTGRIKFGTESNGGLKNVTLANCVFDHSRGLALESVDGGAIEDVTISNLAMRDVSNSPIFIRLGSRLRGPDHPAVGVIRRINLSNLVVSGANRPLSSIISGVPGHPIEGVRLSNIQIQQAGGGTDQDAALQPPEKENGYPEPGMFGPMPAHGFFIRHARDIQFSDASVGTVQEDRRPAFVLEDVAGATFQNVNWRVVAAVPAFDLRQVQDFNLRGSPPLTDRHLDRVEQARF